MTPARIKTLTIGKWMGTDCQEDEKEKEATIDRGNENEETGETTVQCSHNKTDGHSPAGRVTIVPASVRPDGSVRKERRIRPGYRSEAETPKYVPPPMRTREMGRQMMASTTSASAEVIKTSSAAARGTGPGKTVTAATRRNVSKAPMTSTAVATPTVDVLAERLNCLNIVNDPDQIAPHGAVVTDGGNNAARYKLCNGHYEVVTEEHYPYEGLWSP